MPPLKKGATLPQPDWPGIETERLILRQWRAADVAANTAMLGDPLSARFITADRKPVTEPMVGWRNAAIMAGHWVLHGFGMFVVEEKASGTFVGRVGPFYPPVWPGFEVGWGVANQFRGKGYAVEAGAGRDRLVVCDVRTGHDLPLHRSRECGLSSRGAAARRASRRARRCCSAMPSNCG